MYSYGLLHMALKNQGGQLEPTYHNSVRIRGVHDKMIFRFDILIPQISPLGKSFLKKVWNIFIVLIIFQKFIPFLVEVW